MIIMNNGEICGMNGWRSRLHARREVLMEVRIPVEVLWLMTPCSVVVGYQRFGGPCCLHLRRQRGPPNTIRCHNSEDLDFSIHVSGLKYLIKYNESSLDVNNIL